MVREEITALVDLHCPDRQDAEWDVETLLNEMNAIVKLPSSYTVAAFEALNPPEILTNLITYAEEAYDRREAELGAETMRTMERLIMLRTIDTLWVEHLTATDEMRQGIGLQAYGQADPLVAYKREAHDMWGQLLGNIRHQITHSIYHVEIVRQPAQPRPATPVPAGATTNSGNGGSVGGAPERRQPVAAGKARKTGRNDPCPCGSGKKYKKCHGVAA